MMSRMDGAQVVRGLAQAESLDFITKVEVDTSKKMSITILNRSGTSQKIGMIMPDMEIQKEGAVVWSTKNRERGLPVYEAELPDQSETKIIEMSLDFQPPDRGMYSLELTRVVSNPNTLPVPQAVAFEVR
ncbi:MAG: hypothetical protein HYW85_05940 [Deltaproteobacteria bacterium]|nr:hypothetical protein [Deltaproteobacteria bacterium]